MKYYNLTKILEHKAKYNIIFGMRSNGKTYACLRHGIERYWKDGSTMAYIRRYREDFVGKRGDQLFASLTENGVIAEITNNKWDRVIYRARRWYLARWDEERGEIVRQEDPFCFGFSLTEMEHDKSVSYPTIRTIIYDEFITRQYYLNDEFVLFLNVLSTIVRERADATIFMLGNTVNKYCPYFKEMGLKHITEMKAGTIDIYKYPRDLKVAVEYCATPTESTTDKVSRPSDIYFAFDNPKLEMITGGVWELDIYPHLPEKYTPNEVMFRYFIEFDQQILQADIVSKNLDSGIPVAFTYIHAKTTPIKYPDTDIVFSLTPSAKPNWFRNILHPIGEIDRKILHFFRSYKVFYQDNEVGELVKNYMKVVSKETLTS